MDAGKRSIANYFNGQRKLEIPFFQRAYVWEEELLKRFLESMEHISAKGTEYFLGSIIAKQKQTGTSTNSDVQYIIDGQQRLTTLALFFKILCTKEGKQEAFNRMFTMIDNESELCISHNFFDRECFEEIMNQNELKPITHDSRLAKAYNYMLPRVSPDTYNSQVIRNHISFVGIDLNHNEDEQVIFDTINSLGVSLTTGELLKNYLFNKNTVDDYNILWKPVFEADEETVKYWETSTTEGRLKRTNLESFLYAYLHIKINDPVLGISMIDKLRFRTSENLFNQYKDYLSLSEIDHIEFVKDLTEYAKIYRSYISTSILDEEIPCEWGIERINLMIFGLDSTTLIPYVLYLLKNQEDIEERNEIFRALEAYIIRRLICKSTNDNYSDLFSLSLISNQVLTAKTFIEYITLKYSDSSLAMPTDSMLKDGFNKNIIINQRAKGILYLIESLSRDDKHATALKGFNCYSLEHLMPKKWNHETWPTISPFSDDDRNKILRTLGNLAIIPAKLNASISNKSWSIKKNGNTHKHGLNYYADGLVTLNYPLSLNIWDESTIAERANQLFMDAKKKWCFNPKLYTLTDKKTGEHNNPKTHDADYTKYVLNNGEPLNKRDFAYAVIALFVSQHPDLTFLELKDIFPDSMLDKFKGNGTIASVEELLNSNKSEKELNIRYNFNKTNRILESSDNIKFLVCTQWMASSIQNMAKFAIQQGWTVQPIINTQANNATSKGLLEVEYNGITFKSTTSARTFAMVIKEIGIEKVQSLNIMCNKYPLISPERPKNYGSQKIANGCFVMTNTSTARKMSILNQIATALNLDMKITIN